MPPTRREFFVFIGGVLTWAAMPLRKEWPSTDYTEAQRLANLFLRESMAKTVTATVRPGHGRFSIGDDFVVEDAGRGRVFAGKVTEVHNHHDGSYTVFSG